MELKKFTVHVMTPCVIWEGVEAKTQKEAIDKCLPDGILNLPGDFYTFEVIEE